MSNERSKEYANKLRSPKWQKRRLEILSRDKFACQGCQDTESMLVVHHRFYEKDCEPWEYPDSALVTLCQACHDLEHDQYPEYAKTAIDIIKSKGFLSSDFFSIVEAFNGLKVRHAPEVTGTFIKFALTNPEAVEYLWSRFWDSNRKPE